MPVNARYKKDSIDHFEAIFANATLGIIVTNKRGEIVAINPFALKEFGYTADELMGKKVEMLIPFRFRKNHSHYHERYAENPRTRLMGEGLDLFAVTKNGKEFPVEISLSNYNNGDSKYVIAFVSNISVRRGSEAEIARLHAELEAKVTLRTGQLENTLGQLEVSNIRLQEAIMFQKALFDNAGAMIIVTDENGIIRLFNKEASASIGYAPEQVIGKHTPVLFHDKREIDLRRKELFREFGMNVEDDFNVLVEKARRNIHHEEEYMYVRKNGVSFPVQLTYTIITGEIAGFMGIALDISERKKAENDLRKAFRKERELSELKSRFVSIASHEFRTPLSTVLSSSYLIEKYTTAEDQPKREKHLQRIVSAVNTLTDILNDFLSVGKIEEGKLQVRLTEFNIRELVIAIAGEMKNTLKKQQKIRYGHEGKQEVVMDTSLLKHIIMNLVSNAGKFSGEESPVEIKTKVLDDQVVLSVKDYGIGISQEDQKHLTERFFRGANAGAIQGTGLGLHIVSKYAELMNGSVECKSELGKGTEFIITFKK